MCDTETATLLKLRCCRSLSISDGAQKGWFVEAELNACEKKWHEQGAAANLFKITPHVLAVAFWEIIIKSLQISLKQLVHNLFAVFIVHIYSLDKF